jgi:hypothetical protein
MAVSFEKPTSNFEKRKLEYMIGRLSQCKYVSLV